MGGPDIMPGTPFFIPFKKSMCRVPHFVCFGVSHISKPPVYHSPLAARHSDENSHVHVAVWQAVVAGFYGHISGFQKLI